MKPTNNVILFLAIIAILLIMWLYYSYSNKEPFSIESKIPNRIWTYWDGEMPDLVKKCIYSWHKYNPEHDIIILNKQNLGLYLPDGIDIDKLKHSNESAARFSDFVRLLILPTYGGFWMDASIICQTSLDWVHKFQVNTGCEFFGYYRDDFTTIPDKKVIESWFFACVPESRFARDWRDEFIKISNYNTVDDYIQNLKTSGIDMQNIPPERYDYLAIYVSAQVVLQRPKQKYSLQLIKSDDSALKHWIDRGFHSELAANDLVEKNEQHRTQPLIKIVGVVRRELLKFGDKLDILF
jgi:hypothetical protein